MRSVSLVTALAVLAPTVASGEAGTRAGKPEKTSPAAKAGAPAADTATPPAETDEAYAARMAAMEQRVNELKERVFRSKARLNLLRETVLHGVIAGSRAVIVHRNEMGGSYRMVKAVYSIDGSQIFAQTDETGALDDKKEFEVFNGSILPGNHTVSVLLEYKGHGYGLFPYLEGYRFAVRSSYTFAAAEGKQTSLRVVGYEKGNITTDLKDRPAIDFRVSVTSPGAAKARAGQ
jgi:hypothetical protein